VTTRFTFDPASEYYPIWSPDGKTVVFASTRSGQSDIYQKLASGSTSEDTLSAHEGSELPGDWSRDGQTIVYETIGQGTSRDIWALSLSGEKERRPIIQGEFPESQPKLSPNSRWMAYTSNESGRWEIYVQAFPGPGGKWQVSNRGGTEPAWREDGKELYYLSLDRQLMAVEVGTEGDFEVGVPVPLFTAPISANIFTRNRYVSTGDGQKFLFVSPMESASVPATTVVVNWLDAVRPEDAR
jgi:dipeptidyl aminopeptidase/acylaminoacyl peptidase